MKMAFIGGGVMGETLIARLLQLELIMCENIVVSDPDMERLAYLETTYHINRTSINVDAISRANTVVLAIKPQQLGDVAKQIAGQLKADQLLISILAGVRITTLIHELRHDKIIRAMPNTPGQIGMGMTVWTATPNLIPSEVAFGQTVMSGLGEELFLEDEALIDQATAISGSGPAYVMYFLESLIEAGIGIGLTEEISSKLAKQTLIGSAMLANQSDKSPGEIRSSVTSPGGTTAEAMGLLQRKGFRDTIRKAVVACYTKSVSLGNR